jgi:3'-phosphoadenosine 5'-phosphosulfate sulfotransferase (PAPS reductase)/FAD synthetase
MNSTAAGDSNVSSGLLVIGAAVEVNPIERWRYTEVWTVFALHAARKAERSS